jgi:hypothetical protein
MATAEDLNVIKVAREPLATLEFDRISDFSLRPGKFIYHIKGEGLPIYLFAKITNPRLPLIVFGQGMVVRDQVDLPRFQRMDWADSFPENVLILNEQEINSRSKTAVSCSTEPLPAVSGR